VGLRRDRARRLRNACPLVARKQSRGLGAVLFQTAPRSMSVRYLS
jgi:hypothetical protein